jgi:hypothetical protein
MSTGSAFNGVGTAEEAQGLEAKWYDQMSSAISYIFTARSLDVVNEKDQEASTTFALMSLVLATFDHKSKTIDQEKWWAFCHSKQVQTKHLRSLLAYEAETAKDQEPRVRSKAEVAKLSTCDLSTSRWTKHSELCDQPRDYIPLIFKIGAPTIDKITEAYVADKATVEQMIKEGDSSEAFTAFVKYADVVSPHTGLS